MNNIDYREAIILCERLDFFTEEEILSFYDDVYDFYNKNGFFNEKYYFAVKAIKKITNLDIKADLIKKAFYNNSISSDEELEEETFSTKALNDILGWMSFDEQEYILKKLIKNCHFNEVKGFYDIPTNLKFGIELEYTDTSYEEIKRMYQNRMIKSIFKALNVPDDISEDIIYNASFSDESINYKWNYTKETDDYNPEISTPILFNTKDTYNKLEAICKFFTCLGGKIDESTGLHINVGVDYLEDNPTALLNLIILWSECEDLFYKISNEVNDEPRYSVQSIAVPIKNNLEYLRQHFYELNLNIEKDFLKFLYMAQARNRMSNLLGFLHGNLEYELAKAKNDKAKFKVFLKYLSEKKESDTSIRYTSVNFNHMTWEKDDRGRIEFRIFNSSFSPKVILEDILLVSKIFEFSLNHAKNKNFKNDEFAKLLRHDINEEEKLISLLNLLFDNDDDKRIFYDRWKSIHERDMFLKLKVGSNTYIEDKQRKRRK